MHNAKQTQPLKWLFLLTFLNQLLCQCGRETKQGKGNYGGGLIVLVITVAAAISVIALSHLSLIRCLHESWTLLKCH